VLLGLMILSFGYPLVLHAIQHTWKAQDWFSAIFFIAWMGVSAFDIVRPISWDPWIMRRRWGAALVMVAATFGLVVIYTTNVFTQPIAFDANAVGGYLVFGMLMLIFIVCILVLRDYPAVLRDYPAD
jgi:hypothetical protein